MLTSNISNIYISLSLVHLVFANNETSYDSKTLESIKVQCVVSYENVCCIVCLCVWVCVQSERNGFTRPADLRVSDPILEFCPFH